MFTPKLFTTRPTKNGKEFRIGDPSDKLREELERYRGFFIVGYIMEENLVEFTVYDYSEHDREIIREIESVLSSLKYREAIY